MSDDQARSLSGLRILVLDQDRARGDALASLLREAGAEAGTVPEGVEPAIVIAESVPDGIVIDRASPATDPIKLRATLESDAFLRSIVIVPGVLGEAMKDGAMALKRLVSVRLNARLALARNLESGNEADGSVTDVGPGAIVRLAARAPYAARVEVTIGPRLITVSTADGLLLGVTEAIGGKVTQRALDALGALLMADGGRFRISKETKGPVGNLVGEPDEHLRNAAAISRRRSTRPPTAGTSPPAPSIPQAGRAPSTPGVPTRDAALGRTMQMGSPGPAAVADKPPSAPVPAAPRAVVALSGDARPLGRTLLGVAAQSAGGEAAGRPSLPRPGEPRAPIAPSTSPRAPRPAAAAGDPSSEPAGSLPVPREPPPRESRPGPVRSKTLLGMAAPVLPGKAIVAPGSPSPSAPVDDPITSKVETPAEVLVRSKPTELDDDVATDRLERRGPRAARAEPRDPMAGTDDYASPVPTPKAGAPTGAPSTSLADADPLTDSGGDLPTVIGPRPDLVATIADPIPPPSAATAESASPKASPSVVPVRSIVIDDAVTIPRSRAVPDLGDAPAGVTAEIEGPTIPRSKVKPEAASPGHAIPETRESLGHAATIMAMPTPAKPPVSPAADVPGGSSTSEMLAPASGTSEMHAPTASAAQTAVSGTSEMQAPAASTDATAARTVEMSAPAPDLGAATSRATAPADPMSSTWAASSPRSAPSGGRKPSGPDVGADEWSDGGPGALPAPRPRPAEPAPSSFPMAAVVGVVVLGVAVGVGALWALKVGPFAPAPVPSPPPAPTIEPSDEPPEAPPPVEAADDAGPQVEVDVGPSAVAPAPPVAPPTPPTPVAPPSSNPTDTQGGSDTGDDTSGLREAQQALARGDLPGARSAFSRLSSRERTSPHGEALQSQISERQGDLDGAITHARRAAAMRPGRSSYRTRLGELLLRAGAAGAARSEFEAALRTNPRDQTARRALERMGVTPGAGGTTTPSGGTDTPPSGGTDTPPSGGTDTPPSPPSGGTDTPPSGGSDTPAPPPSGGTDTPSPPVAPPVAPPTPPPPPPPDSPGAPP